MSDPAAPGPASVAALVEAIDTRARQAGSEGAASLLRGMLGSVSEILGSIQDRLVSVEELIREGDGEGARSRSDEPSVTEAVQAGLAAFNTRLGRLEEAFVQAVDDSGSGTRAVVEEVRSTVAAALAEGLPSPPVPADDDHGLDVDALVERVTAAVVSALPPPPPALDPSTIDVAGALSPLHERLAELEGKLDAAASSADEAAKAAKAVPAPPPPSPPPPPLAPALEEALEPIRARLIGLEQLIRSRGEERPDAAASLRAAVAPIVERLDGFEVALRGLGEDSSERFTRMDTAVASVPSRLSSMEERLSAVAAAQSVPATIDPAVIERLEGAVERLDRDEASARLVALVEERLTTGLRAVAEQVKAVRGVVEDDAAARAAKGDDQRPTELLALLREVSSAQERVPGQAAEAVGERLKTIADRLGGLDARLDAADAAMAAVNDNVAAVHTQLEPVTELRERLGQITGRLDAQDLLRDKLDELVARPVPEPMPDVADAVAVVVRRESELLTQRVAALAVGVEAARAMLEQHLDDAEQSLGRRASEVTRRLAADFGIRTRSRGSGSRRDPREIGPG